MGAPPRAHQRDDKLAAAYANRSNVLAADLANERGFNPWHLHDPASGALTEDLASIAEYKLPGVGFGSIRVHGHEEVSPALRIDGAHRSQSHRCSKRVAEDVRQAGDSGGRLLSWSDPPKASQWRPARRGHAGRMGLTELERARDNGLDTSEVATVGWLVDSRVHGSEVCVASTRWKLTGRRQAGSASRILLEQATEVCSRCERDLKVRFWRLKDYLATCREVSDEWETISSPSTDVEAECARAAALWQLEHNYDPDTLEDTPELGRWLEALWVRAGRHRRDMLERLDENAGLERACAEALTPFEVGNWAAQRLGGTLEALEAARDQMVNDPGTVLVWLGGEAGEGSLVDLVRLVHPGAVVVVPRVVFEAVNMLEPDIVVDFKVLGGALDGGVLEVVAALVGDGTHDLKEALEAAQIL